MPFNSETARAAQAKSNTKGVRKDAISHGLRESIMRVHGSYPTYFVWLMKNLPSKHADMLSKYIPTEIEQSIAIKSNVLVINMPPERLSASNVSELEAPASNVIDVECEE